MEWILALQGVIWMPLAYTFPLNQTTGKNSEAPVTEFTKTENTHASRLVFNDLFKHIFFVPTVYPVCVVMTLPN